MRTKSFAMLAISSLLTASIAYVAPAMADETSGGMPMEQMLADNSSAASSTQFPSEANTASPALAENMPSDNSSSSNSNSSTNADSDNHANGQNDANSSSGNSTSGSSDQGTPDTATGDDDY